MTDTTTPTIFGQLVVGPPGSGKSTYCKFIQDNLRQLGRNAFIINLDPANDKLIYKPKIDVFELIDVTRVMKSQQLGPNGAMLFCMEYLEKNIEWLEQKMVNVVKECEEDVSKGLSKLTLSQMNKDGPSREINDLKPYFLIDCPGQSELYTHHQSLQNMIKRLTNKNHVIDLRLVCVNLCDAHYASDVFKYIGILVNSLATMLNLEMPQINVLSKVDLVEKYGKTRFNLDYYCEVMDLGYVIDNIDDDPFFERYKELTKALADIVQNYSLVSYIPLNISKADHIYKVLQLADMANGYYGQELDLSILQQNPMLANLAAGRRMDEDSHQLDKI